LLRESVGQTRTALDRAYHRGTGPLQLEFFHSAPQFSVRTMGVPQLGALAVCFGPVITFIGPYEGLFNVRTVIHHELAHVYAVQASKGRVPRWFTEGLSEWESELVDPAWARESAELLQAARKAGKLRKLGELELAFMRAESPMMMEVAYATSAYAVRYLGTTYGRDKLIAMLEGYGEGKHTDELVRLQLGTELASLERAFEKWFHGELDRKLSGWQPHPRHKSALDAVFVEAVQLARERKFEPARTKLERLRAQGGDGFATQMLLGKLAKARGKSTDARKHFEAARQFHRESLDPIVELIALSREADDHASETRYLSLALGIDANALDPAAQLLALALATDNRPAARAALDRVRAIAPLHPIGLSGAAEALARTGRSKLAKQWLARATANLREDTGGPAATFLVTAIAADALNEAELARRMAKLALARGSLGAALVAKASAIANKKPD
jgi:tetratricopeptide (TPR) repeat protein